jgi:hypothetical protein
VDGHAVAGAWFDVVVEAKVHNPVVVRAAKRVFAEDRAE